MAPMTPAVGQHAVEHRHMGMKLRVRRLQRHLADIGVGPALPVSPLDIDGRPRGVVLEADPSQSRRARPHRARLLWLLRQNRAASRRRPSCRRRRSGEYRGGRPVPPPSAPRPRQPTATCRPKTSCRQTRPAGAWRGSAGGNPPYRSAARSPVGRSPGVRSSSAVASRCAGRPSAALNRLRAPSTISAGSGLPAAFWGMPPSARLPASTFRIASADAGCFGSRPNNSATLLVARMLLAPSDRLAVKPCRI